MYVFLYVFLLSKAVCCWLILLLSHKYIYDSYEYKCSETIHYYVYVHMYIYMYLYIVNNYLKLIV